MGRGKEGWRATVVDGEGRDGGHWANDFGRKAERDVPHQGFRCVSFKQFTSASGPSTIVHAREMGTAHDGLSYLGRVCLRREYWLRTTYLA